MREWIGLGVAGTAYVYGVNSLNEQRGQYSREAGPLILKVMDVVFNLRFLHIWISLKLSFFRTDWILSLITHFVLVICHGKSIEAEQLWGKNCTGWTLLLRSPCPSCRSLEMHMVENSLCGQNQRPPYEG